MQHADGQFGLILVDPETRPARVQVAFHPVPFQPRRRNAQRRAVLEEIAGRSGDFNEGGSVKTKLVTAYRERAVHLACCLRKLGPMTPRALRALGTGPKTYGILYDNHYGWFDRVGRGLYSLKPEGLAALDAYPELTARFSAALESLEAAVEATYRDYVEALKAASDDGRLTPDERAHARALARDRAVAIARANGVDLLRELGEDYLDLWIARLVRKLKA